MTFSPMGPFSDCWCFGRIVRLNNRKSQLLKHLDTIIKLLKVQKKLHVNSHDPFSIFAHRTSLCTVCNPTWNRTSITDACPQPHFTTNSPAVQQPIVIFQSNTWECKLVWSVHLQSAPFFMSKEWQSRLMVRSNTSWQPSFPWHGAPLQIYVLSQHTEW